MLTESGGMSGAVGLAMPTVELVEDDPSMQRALAANLRDHGYAVNVYTSRKAYIAAARPEGPRVVLLDMRLKDSSGLEIRDWLQGQSDRAPVIFLSGQSTPQEIIDALKGGAHDCLLKPFRLPELLQALERAFERQHEDQDQAARTKRLKERWSGLTQREREVCVLMLKGMANREIARINGSMPGTVKVHRARILQKMGAHSLADLFRLAAGEDLADWLAREQGEA